MAKRFNIYRSTSPGVSPGAPGVVGIPGVTPPYTDNDVVNGTTYYYVATEVNAEGESAPSNEISATPTAATIKMLLPFPSTTAFPATDQRGMIYDVSLDSWSFTALSQATYQPHDGLFLKPDDADPVYAAGGLPGGATSYIFVQSYDPVLDAWTSRPNVGVFTGLTSAGHVMVPSAVHPSGNSRLYNIGGVNIPNSQLNAQSALVEYNPSAGYTNALLTAAPTQLWVPWADYTTLSASGNPIIVVLASTKNPLAAGACGNAGRDVVYFYDIVLDSWSVGPPLAAGSFSSQPGSCGLKWCSAVVLQNGQILTVGGQTDTLAAALTDCLLLDPAAGTWTPTGSLAAGVFSNGVVVLNDGRVLSFGGNVFGPVATCEIYDPILGTWSAAAPMNVARDFMYYGLIPDGRVLVVGGLSGGSPLQSGEIYDPVGDTWTPTAVPPLAAWKADDVSGNIHTKITPSHGAIVALSPSSLGFGAFSCSTVFVT